MKTVNVKFGDTFHGEMIAKRGTAKLGKSEGELEPYDMLLGALASCMYATFLAVAQNKKAKFKSVDMQVEGEKREEKPAALKWVNIDFTLSGVAQEDKKKIERSIEVATKYCSIYHTIGQVAEMSYTVEFED